MKKSYKIIPALILVLGLALSLAACKDNKPIEPCTTHTDSDGNGVCDICKSAVKAPAPECTHKDLDDNGRCDDCDEAFSDGCNNHLDKNDDLVCDVEGCSASCNDGCDNHVDKNDDAVCDNTDCGATYVDGCDNHVDKNDDGVCDVSGCGTAFTDGCNKHVDKNDDGVCDNNGCNEPCNDGCDNHKDANDDGICDVSGCDKSCNDGCDNHTDKNNDGICDTVGCDEVVGSSTPVGDSFENAVELTEGIAASHSIHTYAQKHYYKLTASTTGTYDVKFSGSYFYITVFSEANTSVATATWEVQFASDVTVNTVDLTAGGLYYFVITSMYEYGYPEITVAPSTGSSTDDTTGSQGIDFDNATSLVPNADSTTYTGAADQSLCFVFTATETLNYIITIQSDSLFPLLTVYDVNKVLLATYYNNWGTISQTIPIKEGETYYFVVTMQIYEGAFDLTFTSSDVPVCLEHVFTNDCDTTCNNEGCSGTQVPKHAYDNDCDPTCNNEGCATPNRTVFGHVDVSPADGKCDSCGTDVSSEQNPSVPKFDTAVTLVPGNNYSLLFDNNSTAYYYIYTATETGDHNITINAGSGYPCLKIYDASEKLILGPEYGEFGTINIDQAMTSGESYYIVVSVIYAPANLSFTFSTPKTDGSDDTPVAGGGTSFSDATEIIPGTKYTVSLDKVGKKVYFKFTATETASYHVYVSGNNNTMLQVWRDQENTHQSPVNANWGTGVIDTDLATFTEGETYYIILSVSGRATLEFIFTDAN